MSKAKIDEIRAIPFKELYDRLTCDTGLIFIDTPEETRVIREVYRKFKNGGKVFFWSIGQGLHEIDSSKIVVDTFYPHKFASANARMGKEKTFDTRANPLHAYSVIEEDCRDKIKADGSANSRKDVYVLRDLDKFLKDPTIVRKLKDLVYLCSTTCSSIIVTGYGLVVPSDLEKDSVFIKLKYPTKDEIKETILANIRAKIENHNKKHSNKMDDSFNDDEVANACVGLTEDQILNVIQYTMITDGKININKIIEEKKSIINKSDILEYWDCKESLDSIGGFKEIKDWFGIQKTIINNSENAAKFFAKPPKAALLLGVQGSGKTACAKALAQDWKTGLIKFDIGKVFAGLVGESEKRMRQGLAQADAVGGIIVIDEIDKGLSGAGSSDKTDGGTTNRVIGSFLTWLNEDHPGVFLIATANDISALRKNHPELLRKGRFDEIWFSDVPNQEEREEIFGIHLKKKQRDPTKFDIKKLAEYEYKDPDGTCFSITGAEIEAAVEDAVRYKFAQGGGKEIEIGSKDDITTNDILDQLKKIKPITKIGKETISVMRKWSEDNARNVSGIKLAKKKSKTANVGDPKVNFRTDEVDI